MPADKARDDVENTLEADISYCARESVLDVVPRFVGRHEAAAEIRL